MSKKINAIKHFIRNLSRKALFKYFNDQPLLEITAPAAGAGHLTFLTFFFVPNVLLCLLPKYHKLLMPFSI